MDLAGKVAIVTGGGTGIGKAVSESLAKNGARVAVASRNLSHLEAAQELFKRLDRPLLTIQMDIRKKEHVQKAVSETLAAWGAIDILVNNAGISGLNRMDDPAEG
jgi:NAD(P)-dependent dehydrogenase (short-subunit alcohol dehydrogenase family)